MNTKKCKEDMESRFKLLCPLERILFTNCSVDTKALGSTIVEAENFVGSMAWKNFCALFWTTT